MISLSGNDDYMQLGKAIEQGSPIQLYDSIYETEITWFSDYVLFLQNVRLNAPVSRIEGMIDYMACNDHLCIPDRMEFTVPLRASVEKH